MKPALAGTIAVAGCLLLTVVPACADGVHGRILIQDVFAADDSRSLAAALGLSSRNDLLGDLRLSWEPRRDNWDFAFHYQLTSDYGDTPALIARETALGLLPVAPPASMWNLSDTFVAHSHLTATHLIDRLSIGYSAPHFVLRIGRQALTWGAGLVFRPMDLFAPFAPNATDTEYKPGTDMIYAQWLFDDGSDLQFIVVPRAGHFGHLPTVGASSAALHLRTTIAGLPTTAMLARDHGDWVAGIGLNGPLSGATWNLEAVPTFLRSGGTRLSLLANISYALTLFDRNATAFAEYFHNGFGIATDRHTLMDLPDALRDRLARGQLFDTGRDEFAGGLTLECTPLVTLSPTLIVNLNDGSFYALAQTTWSLSDNLTLVAGGQLPIGPSGTEFGGIAVDAMRRTFAGPSPEIYLQLRQYF